MNWQPMKQAPSNTYRVVWVTNNTRFPGYLIHENLTQKDAGKRALALNQQTVNNDGRYVVLNYEMLSENAPCIYNEVPANG